MQLTDLDRQQSFGFCSKNFSSLSLQGQKLLCIRNLSVIFTESVLVFFFLFFFFFLKKVYLKIKSDGKFENKKKKSNHNFKNYLKL